MKSQATVNENIVADALLRFYRDHGLGTKGGEDTRWAKVKMGWFNFYIPNTASRKRALFFHDVHHLATGYGTDLRSEAEIGAWEVASGCRDFWAAWVLNYLGLVMGLFISPVRTFKAFIRGRNSRNLYYGMMSRQEIEQATIDEVRQKIELAGSSSVPRLMDVILFLIWTTPILAVMIGLVGVIVELLQ